MPQGRPPSKPKKFLKKGRDYFYAQYWEDRLGSDGEIVGRQQRHVALYDETGQRITSPRLAERACDRLHGEVLARWNGTASGTTALEDYKTAYVEARSHRKGTARSYQTKLDDFLKFLKDEYRVARFSDVTREMVKRYLDDRLNEVKLVTVHGDLRAIRAFFNEAVRDNRVKDNPCKKIKLAPLSGAGASEGFFLPSEMNAIVDYCRTTEPVWYPIFAGFRYAPFRREELCFLEWEDVDLKRDVIQIRDAKSKYHWHPKRTGRTMDLHPTLRDELEKLPRPDSFIFQHPDGTTYSDKIAERRELGRKAWRKVKSLCDALDLEKKDETGTWKRRFPNGPHVKAFRSGISCELQLNGAPLAYVQEQLGHHDSSITLTHYTHLVPDLMGKLTKKFIASLGSASASKEK